MALDIATSYDELPYGDKVFAQTHPGVLATMAALMGLKPAPPKKCRLLELGCGSGGNLMPLACSLPESDFVGVDLSPRQIEQGQATQNTLGLNNLQLHAADILAIDESWGRFDYIVCHGVYSWVPPEVQDRILALCRLLLNPHGVAYISYNTYPGWHFRGLIRDFLTFHCRSVEGILPQVAAARDFLRFLPTALPRGDHYYAAMLKSEVELALPGADSYIYHEHLEAHNQPLYFYQFMERAERHGLQYLGEAEPNPLAPTLTAEVMERIHQMARTLVEVEQYVDLFTGRGFRRTLLGHRGSPVSRKVNLETLLRMSVSTLAQPVTESPRWDDDSEIEFQTPMKVLLSSNNPVMKLALQVLDERRPAALPVPELSAAVRARLAHPPPLGEGIDPVTRVLAESLLRCHQTQLIELHCYPPADTQVIGERPAASPLARLQADLGQDRLTTLRSQLVEPGAFERMLTPFLDGTRDRTALIETILDLAHKDVFEVKHDGQVVTDDKTMRQILASSIDQSLQRIARSSILLA